MKSIVNPSFEKLRVLVIEDNFFARLGTVTLIGAQADMQVLAEADSGSAGIEMFRRLHAEIDVVVSDMRLGDLDGTSVAAALVHEQPDARVLILSQHDGEEDIYRAIKAGARGYVTKDLGGQALLSGVRALARGERFLPEAVAARLADRLAQPELTTQEQRVLERLCRGLSNGQIAADLSISQKTASVYVSTVLKKLDARNRTEAAALARQRGLVR